MQTYGGMYGCRTQQAEPIFELGAQKYKPSVVQKTGVRDPNHQRNTENNNSIEDLSALR